jgi:hypothetical protein
MIQKYSLSLLAALLATGCVGDPNGPVRTDTTKSVAYQGGVQQIDLTRGVWGTQSIDPPPGLVTVRQGDLIGRTVNDSSGTGVLAVEYLLVDPATGDARYAVTSSNQFGDYLLVPLSALRITPYAVSVDTTARTLAIMPRISGAALERRFPRTTLTGTIAPVGAMAGFPPAGFAPVPGVAPNWPVSPNAEQLQLVHRGSVVGYLVFDSFGQPVGTVDTVAARPGSGEVRYAIVSGPSFGPGYFIAVPAANAQTANGRVVITGSLANWDQAPRYHGDQIQQTFGVLGNVN